MKPADSMFKGALQIKIAGEDALLLPEKGVYFPQTSELLLSDLHLGKSTHFRREGIAVPSILNSADLIKLGRLIGILKPDKVIILGDLFHTGHSKDAELFADWRKSYTSASFILIKGNHDRIADHILTESGIESHTDYMLREFRLIHHHSDSEANPGFVISGHVHPAVRVSGKARQSAVLQCFHISKNVMTLPAFGEFTGSFIIRPEKGDRIFAVVSDRINSSVVSIE